jgi:lipopolysaccharide transport system ATP-binding protein
MIKDRFCQEVFGTNSHLLQHPLLFEAGKQSRVCFEFSCNLGPGHYTLSAALHQGSSHVEGCQHWLDHALSFEVHAWSNYPYVGLAVQPIHRLTQHIQEG